MKENEEKKDGKSIEGEDVSKSGWISDRPMVRRV